MNLVILDIDGTLTETSDVDADCFTLALKECFGIDGIETDWSLYAHTTDVWILDELFQKHFNRSPSADEVTQMQNSFVDHLQHTNCARRQGR